MTVSKLELERAEIFRASGFSLVSSSFLRSQLNDLEPFEPTTNYQASYEPVLRAPSFGELQRTQWALVKFRPIFALTEFESNFGLGSSSLGLRSL